MYIVNLYIMCSAIFSEIGQRTMYLEEFRTQRERNEKPESQMHSVGNQHLSEVM